MIKFIKNYYVSMICIFITLIYTFMSNLVELGIKSQIVTIIIYIPLIIAIILFIINFVKSFSTNQKLKSNSHYFKIIFIFFAIYCIFLFVYRLITGLEYMEGIHFAARIIGAIGLYFVVVESTSSSSIMNNLLIYAGLLDLTLIIDFIMNGTFRDTKIMSNVLIVCCITLILSLVCIKYLKLKKSSSIVYNIICLLHFFVLILTTMLSGSRTMLVLGGILIVYTVLFVLMSKKHMLKYLIVSICSIVTLIGLYSFNVGDAVFTIDKQMMFIIPNIYTKVIDNKNVPKDNVNLNNDEQDVIVPDSNEDKLDEGKESSNEDNLVISEDNKEQINNSEETVDERLDTIKKLENDSDYMRSILRSQGVEEFKKNMLFGTGNVYFDYTLGERKLEQTAHNFVIETLISFGIIGTLILTLIVGMIIYGVLSNRFISIDNKIELLIMCIVVGAFSLYQQMLYNYIILPVVFLIIAMYQTSMHKGNNN